MCKRTNSRSKKTAEKTSMCVCPGCGRNHFVDPKTFSEFGPDTWCMVCVDDSHVAFMKKNAVKFKMTCVANCFCGFGVKEGVAC